MLLACLRLQQLQVHLKCQKGDQLVLKEDLNDHPGLKSGAVDSIAFSATKLKYFNINVTLMPLAALQAIAHLARIHPMDGCKHAELGMAYEISSLDLNF